MIIICSIDLIVGSNISYLLWQVINFKTSKVSWQYIPEPGKIQSWFWPLQNEKQLLNYLLWLKILSFFRDPARKKRPLRDNIRKRKGSHITTPASRSMGVRACGSMGVKISLHPHLDTPKPPYFLPLEGSSHRAC